MFPPLRALPLNATTFMSAPFPRIEFRIELMNACCSYFSTFPAQKALGHYRDFARGLVLLAGIINYSAE